MLTFELPFALHCLLNTAEHCSTKPQTFYFTVAEDETFKTWSRIQYLLHNNVWVNILNSLKNQSIIFKGNVVFSNVKYREYSNTVWQQERWGSQTCEPNEFKTNWSGKTYYPRESGHYKKIFVSFRTPFPFCIYKNRKSCGKRKFLANFISFMLYTIKTNKTHVL